MFRSTENEVYQGYLHDHRKHGEGTQIYKYQHYFVFLMFTLFLLRLYNICGSKHVAKRKSVTYIYKIVNHYPAELFVDGFLD